MALLYKQNESRTVVTRSVTRPGSLRVGLAIGIPGIRLCTYLLTARILGVRAFGLFLLMQWLAYAILPLIGIGIDPVARRRIASLQGQEPEYGAAPIFHFLLHSQYRRILYYAILYIPLAYILSFASKGLLPLSLLLLAALAALPLLMGSIVGIALQSQERFLFLSLLAVLNALLVFSLVSLVPFFPTAMRMVLLLAIPTLVHIITLTIATLYLVRILPLREKFSVGPLLKQKLVQAARASSLSFLTDVFIWRELPLLVLLLLLWHTQTSLIELSFYAFSLLLCTRLIEVAPTCFITCLLPLCSHLHKRFMKRSLSQGSYDAFIQATCYVSLLASILCTLLTFLCPQLIVWGLGATYLPMIKMLRILLIAVVFSSIATVSLTQLERRFQFFEQQGHHRRNHLYLRLGTVIMYSILMILCIALWGMNGAALASMLVRVGFAFCSILQCHRLLRIAPSLPSRLPIAF